MPGLNPRPALLAAAVLLLAVGCSESVGYDEDFRLPGSTPITLDGFSPTTLSHLQLRGLVANASVWHGVLTNYKGKTDWKATDSGRFFDDPI